MEWSKWLPIIGGVVAVVGQWQPDYFLPVIGGAIAIIGGFMK